MKSVKTAELKDHLSAHLRAVEAGEEIVATEGRRPIARIVPMPPLAPRVEISLPRRELRRAAGSSAYAGRPGRVVHRDAARGAPGALNVYVDSSVLLRIAFATHDRGLEMAARSLGFDVLT